MVVYAAAVQTSRTLHGDRNVVATEFGTPLHAAKMRSASEERLRSVDNNTRRGEDVRDEDNRRMRDRVSTRPF
ncbi:hypothetical protein NDU88_007313 [Pleurodeles waltl]|uniref:Uncharacterized protein n=1 Tax=Pleurodeles waltl TaxID=8319 RepID=A0AAV7TZQ1_PLEWA|nr:hypothetical protein NDU88_007313 [Pleurodeles waltl]